MENKTITVKTSFSFLKKLKYENIQQTNNLNVNIHNAKWELKQIKLKIYDKSYDSTRKQLYINNKYYCCIPTAPKTEIKKLIKFICELYCYGVSLEKIKPMVIYLTQKKTHNNKQYIF